MENLLAKYRIVLENTGLSGQWANLLENFTVLLLIALLAFLSDRIVKFILIRLIGNMIKSSKNKFDDILLKKRLFSRVAHIAPALVVNATVIFLVDAPGLVDFIKVITE